MNDLSNQIEYWDTVAWDKTFTLPVNLEKFRELIPLDARILDYGCGYGRVCAELRDAGYSDVIGIDSSPEMIRRARQDHPELRFEVIDTLPMPFPDNSFDAVLLFAVLTCIPTNEGQRTLIADIRRVLKPGGILHISDYPLQNDERYLERYRQFAEEFGVYGVFSLPEGAVVRHHSVEWIRSLTSDFETLHWSEADAITMNGNRARTFQYFGGV